MIDLYRIALRPLVKMFTHLFLINLTLISDFSYLVDAVTGFSKFEKFHRKKNTVSEGQNMHFEKNGQNYANKFGHLFL